MSDNQTPEQHDYRTAQADAKAAKARAKALRPWYKKKRYILGGALVAIVLIGIAGSAGSSDDETDSTPATTSGSGSSAPTVAQSSGGLVRGSVGQLLQVGDLNLTIEGVENVNTKTFNQFNDANVRVKVSATNARGAEDRTYNISLFAFKLVDGNGVAHDPGLGCAGCPNEIASTSLTKGGSITGYVYFALPAGTTMTELRYEPLFSTNKAFISLK